MKVLNLSSKYFGQLEQARDIFTGHLKDATEVAVTVTSQFSSVRVVMMLIIMMIMDLFQPVIPIHPREFGKHRKPRRNLARSFRNNMLFLHIACQYFSVNTFPDM